MVTVSILTMLGLGLLCSCILAVSSKIFYVKENPLVTAALELLPGANCGGCGFAGCEGYAKAVATDPEIPADRCCACSKETVAALGKLTGKDVGDSEPMISMRRCDVNNGSVLQRYVYEGIPSCAAASEIRGGMNACSWSCLGFGDCVQACPFGAMKIVEGVACVDIKHCTGCGLCVKACPRKILELIPLSARVCVPCNSRDKGKQVMDACKAGCIKCGRCVKVCPAKAISIEDGRVEINQKLCLEHGPGCEQACVKACARKILRSIDLAGRDSAGDAGEAASAEEKEAVNA